MVYSHFLCPFFFVIALKAYSVNIETPYAILINAETGHVLYEKNSHIEVYPASTVKIATALYVLKLIGDDLDDFAVCSQEALRMASPSESKYDVPYLLEPDAVAINLKAQEKIKVRHLLEAALIASACDACNVLAEHVSGSILSFVKELNTMARAMGCRKTHFCNPHGLFHSNQKISAYDLVVLAQEAWKFQFFREAVKKLEYLRPVTNKYIKKNLQQFKQTNKLLFRDSPFYYPYALGMKTGYLQDAKYNLVAVASNGEREVIVVLLQSPSNYARYIDAIKLFEMFFSEVKEERCLFVAEEMDFYAPCSWWQKKIVGTLSRDLYLHYFPSEEESVETKVLWEVPPLPIKKGDYVGKVLIHSQLNGKLLLQSSLFSKEDVKRGLFVHFLMSWWGLFVVIILGCVFFFIVAPIEKR